MKQLRVNLDVSEPRFKVGEVVALRSDPTILLPIIEVISSGSERRYKVFQNNTKQVFYESQLQTSAVAAGDHGDYRRATARSLDKFAYSRALNG